MAERMNAAAPPVVSALRRGVGLVMLAALVAVMFVLWPFVFPFHVRVRRLEGRLRARARQPQPPVVPIRADVYVITNPRDGFDQSTIDRYALLRGERRERGDEAVLRDDPERNPAELDSLLDRLRDQGRPVRIRSLSMPHTMLDVLFGFGWYVLLLSSFLIWLYPRLR